MQSLSICYRCRLSLFGSQLEKWTDAIPQNVFKRHRSTLSSNTRRTNSHKRDRSTDQPRHHPEKFQASLPQTSRNSPRFQASEGDGKSTFKSRHFSPQLRRWNPSPKRPEPPNQPSRIAPDKVVELFEQDVQRWSEHRALHSRFLAFGIPEDDITPLLRTFVHAVQLGKLSTTEAFEKYHLIRLSQDLSEDGYYRSIDIIYSTILFTWASDPLQADTLRTTISPATVEHIQSLSYAANRFHPPDEYPEARSMHRKVIMHVGPTNSGKTHNALRALAAAETGVYAGPLRLLAHEIWERLNLGQIIPAGVEETAVTPRAEPDTNSALDVGGTAPAVRKVGNPKYARLCNMITGEEQKIVDLDARLVSCTVEMLSYKQLYDVAVIDEIQMIGNPERGNGWTSAVLGLRAKELHLCGEESAVPLVQELLKETGDEVIINRYERLTPLRVEGESLDGDLSLVQKGDCIVTFSRSSIFALKQRIEGQTSMRCAVVYGRLPPEIRSEQAALFNDPDSGYDVIIGSDAIGMGLNLKIKRIVFEAVRKFDGGGERLLSVSQTKQIAGRAGRYGLHEDKQNGGFTTTMIEADLEFLRNTLDLTVPPLPFARIGPNRETFKTIASVLPHDSPTMAIFDAHTYIAMLPPIYRFTSILTNHYLPRCNFIDTCGAGLTIEDRLLFTLVPISWRDDLALEIIATILRMHGENMNVDLLDVLEPTSVRETLELVEEKMKSRHRHQPKATVDELSRLESFHKVLVMYIWMTFRQPLVYHQYTEATDLKNRLEKALDWALQSLTRDQPLRVLEPARKNIPYVSRIEANKSDLSRQRGNEKAAAAQRNLR